MKQCTRRRWPVWITASACLLAACGGDNDGPDPASGSASAESAKFATPVASVGGAIRGASFSPPLGGDANTEDPVPNVPQNDAPVKDAKQDPSPTPTPTPNLTPNPTPNPTADPKPVEPRAGDEPMPQPEPLIQPPPIGPEANPPAKPPADSSNRDKPSGHGESDARPVLRVGGIVEGLAPDMTLKLFNNRDELLPIEWNGAFAFKAEVPKGGRYSVSVAIQPRGQFCAVSNAQGMVEASSITTIKVDCKRREQIALAMGEALREVVSFRADAKTGELKPTSGPSLRLDVPVRRLLMGPSGDFALLLRTDIARGTNFSWPNFKRPVSRFSISRSTGELGKLEEFEWASKSGVVLDYAFNRHGDKLIALQDGRSYGVVNVDLPNGRADKSLSFADASWKPELKREPNVIDCPRTDTPVTPANRLDLTGNFRLTNDARFGYMLRCDFATKKYKLDRYVVDPATGMFLWQALGEGMDAAAFSVGFAIDPPGHRIYSLDGTSRMVRTLAIDPKTGALTPLHEASLDFAGNEIVLSGDGRRAYVMHPGNHAVSVWKIDPETGGLTPMRGTPFFIGAEPHRMVLDASESFAYVLLNGERAIATYKLHPRTKAFEWISDVHMFEGVGDIVLTP